jgi:hypothetical protein
MLLLFLAIVLAALLAGASDARAARPTVYGGAFGPHSTPLALELAPRASLGAIGRVVAGVDVPCPGDQGALAITVNERIVDPHTQIVDPYNIPASAILLGEWDGSRRFSAEGYSSIEFDDNSSGVTRYLLAGRIRGATVRGTLALSVDLHDAAGNPVGTCDTGQLHWSARSAPGRIYAGATSDDQAVVIRLDRARRRVTRADIGQWQACREAAGFLAHNFFDGPLRAGRFSDASRYPRTGGHGRDAFQGRIGRARASGTFRDRQTFVDAGQTFHCDSGPLRWTARTSPRR